MSISPATDLPSSPLPGTVCGIAAATCRAYGAVGSRRLEGQEPHERLPHVGRSLAHVHHVLLLAVACGGGSGNNNGGGNNPSLAISPASSTVIAGGSPVNFTATLANTTGTVSWALSGPGSIDPATGDTTSYTPPASVASSTTATLTATSGTLTASATITVNPPPTITVAGTVEGLGQQGCLGGDGGDWLAAHDERWNGCLQPPGVTAPYDAVLIVPVGARNAAVVYKGLTRADPRTSSPSRCLRACPTAGRSAGR